MRLEHSFLRGESVWEDVRALKKTSACGNDDPIAGRYSARCTTFLDSSEKAAAEWMLERQFEIFEKNYSVHK